MPMYHWQSKLFKNWGDGDIIAVAPDVETARDLVRSKWFECWAESRLWGPDELDDEEREEVEAARGLLEADISGDPVVTDVVFVWGSD